MLLKLAAEGCFSAIAASFNPEFKKDCAKARTTHRKGGQIKKNERMRRTMRNPLRLVCRLPVFYFEINRLPSTLSDPRIASNVQLWNRPPAPLFGR